MNVPLRNLLTALLLSLLSVSQVSAELRVISPEEATRRLAVHGLMLNSVFRTLSESNTPPEWVGREFEVVSDSEGNTFLAKEGVRIEGTIDEPVVAACKDRVPESYEESTGTTCANAMGSCKIIAVVNSAAYCKTVGEPCGTAPCKKFVCDFDDDIIGKVTQCGCAKNDVEGGQYKNCKEEVNPVPTPTITATSTPTLTPTPRNTPTRTPTRVPVKRKIGSTVAEE